ncbi:40S ribosomal protein S3 [Conglomerata obtusa]
MPKPVVDSDPHILNRFINFGLIYAELNEYFAKEFQEDGYSSCEIKHHNLPVQIILRISKPAQEVIGTEKFRIKQIKSLVAKRLELSTSSVEILIEVIKKKGLCPVTQAEFIRSKLIAGMTVRRAVNSAMRNIKDDSGQGCEIIISGKTKGQRARSMKFVDGLIIHSGQPKQDYMRAAMSSVLLKQGLIGIKVKIMLPYDQEGINGPSKEIADKILVFEPKENNL